MPGFKSMLSTAVYHSVTRPAVMAGAKYARNVISKYKKKLGIYDHNTHMDVHKKNRTTVLNKTRGGAMNARLFSKKTPAGQNRRAMAAAATKQQRRSIRGGGSAPATKPANSHTGYTPGASRTPTKPTPTPHKPAPASPPKKAPPTKAQIKAFRKLPRNSTISAVASSKTHGELRRKLINQSVRNIGRKNPLYKGMDKKDIADNLRVLRKVDGPGLKKRIRAGKIEKLKEAANILSKKA